MNTIRINFNKTGLASYFSHLDLQRVVARALKKSELPVWYSQGYNPHVYITFTLPLSLGHESVCESFDCRLNEELDEQIILSALKGTLPDGIDITGAGEPKFDAKNIRWAIYQITIYDEKSKILEALSSYKQLTQAMVLKKTKKKDHLEINLRELIKDIKVLDNSEKFDSENLIISESTSENTDSQQGTTITALFPAGVQLNINPNLLLEFLETTYDLDVIAAKILRVKLYDENLAILI